MAFFILCSLVIAALAAIPYGIWAIITASRKQWRKLAWQLGLPVAYFAVLGVADEIATRIESRRDLQGYFDAKVVLPGASFEYDTERDFKGDGYSLAIYPLPPAIRERFRGLDESLRTGFPIRPQVRQHWRSLRWREAPSGADFAPYLKFALTTGDSNEDRQLFGVFQDLRAALARRGTYYAALVYDHEETPGNIDLFVIDTLHSRLYLINHNT